MGDSDQFDAGTIVGAAPGIILVQLDTGTTVKCAGIKQLHRKWGFYTVPIGQRILISRVKLGSQKLPRIVDLIKEEKS